MDFTNIPEQFSGSGKAALYRIEGLPHDAVTHVQIIDSDTSEILGVKRFSKRPSVEVNISPYLRSRLAPEPLPGGECSFRMASGRSVAAIVKVGSAVSTERIFTAGVGDVDEYGLQTLMAGPRFISRGEYDEISFVSPGGAADFTVSMIMDDEHCVMRSDEYILDRGPATLVVDVDRLREFAAGYGFDFDKCRGLRVCISAAGRDIAEIPYEIVAGAEGSARVCWLNDLGGIDYFTFRFPQTEEAVAHTSKALGRQAYRSGGLRRERLLSVASEYLPYNSMKALAGLISSPKVWLLRSAGFVPVDILTDSVAVRSDSLCGMKLTLREIYSQNF